MSRYNTGPTLRLTALAVAVAAFCGATAAIQAAPGAPIGGAVAVTAKGMQAVVASDAAGDYLVAWASKNFNCFCWNEDSIDIVGQRYTAAGVPVGGNFAVAKDIFSSNKKLADQKGHPQVAMDAEGDFVAAWDEYDIPGLKQVKVRRFAAGAVAQGAEILVSGHGAFPSVAMEPDGDFAVAWGTGLAINVPLPYPLGYGDVTLASTSSVHVRRYHANGLPATLDVTVDSVTNSILAPKSQKSLTAPQVAVAPDGSFVVAWQKVSVGQAAPILLQRYSAAGARIGAQIQANSLAGLQAGAPVLATDGTGEFMVAWQAAPAGAPTQIYVRAFRADGSPRAAETQINSGVGGSVPSIAANAAGNYAVSWVGAGSGTLYGPQLRLLHADGSVASPQVSVFAGPPYSNVPSPVAVDANGNAVLVNSINTLGGGPVSVQRISAR